MLSLFFVGFMLLQSQPQPKQADATVVIAALADQLRMKAIDQAICIAITDQLMKENEQLRQELAKLKNESDKNSISPKP